MPKKDPDQTTRIKTDRTVCWTHMSKGTVSNAVTHQRYCSEPSLQRQHLFPKDVAIKMNLLLYRILNEQIDLVLFLFSHRAYEHMFWIFVRIASMRRF